VILLRIFLRAALSIRAFLGCSQWSNRHHRAAAGLDPNAASQVLRGLQSKN